MSVKITGFSVYGTELTIETCRNGKHVSISIQLPPGTKIESPELPPPNGEHDDCQHHSPSLETIVDSYIDLYMD